MGQVFGASKPSPSFKPSRTKQFIRHVMGVGKNCPVDLLEGQDGSQSLADTSLRCLNSGIALLQWMIAGMKITISQPPELCQTTM